MQAFRFQKPATPAPGKPGDEGRGFVAGRHLDLDLELARIQRRAEWVTPFLDEILHHHLPPPVASLQLQGSNRG